LSFHCIVCYDVFDSEINYPVVLACGHTYVCVNCAKRLTKCMECRISLLYPLECDPAYHAAVAAADKEEKIKASQNRKPRDRSVMQQQPNNLPPIRVKPEDRLRLPAPKNLVLSTLMEATIGTLATSQSVDLDEQQHNQQQQQGDDDEDKRIVAGVSIVTGGCGTYAVSSKAGVTVYPWKMMAETSINSSLSSDETKPKDNVAILTPRKQQQSPSSSVKSMPHPSALNHIFSDHPNQFPMVPTLESLPSLEQQEKTSSDSTTEKLPRSTFQLKFGDHVQVVEMESDGWAKLARGNGYILAEHGHGSELVKVGGPKDKACLLEGMMYSILRRYISLQKDQDDLIRTLESLRRDLNAALVEGKDDTIVAAENVLTSDSTDRSVSSHDYPNENVAKGKIGSRSEEEEDSFYPTKQVVADLSDVEPKSVSQTFIENLPVIGRFVCGGLGQAKEELERNNTTASPGTKARIQREVVLQACRDDSALIQTVASGIDFRTGMSGHRALLSSHSHSHEMPANHRNPNPRLMSVHSGVAYTRRRPWSKATIEASFASFPGVMRRPRPLSPSPQSSSTTTQENLRRTSKNEEGRSSHGTPTNNECGNNFVARIAVAKAPSTVAMNNKPAHSCTSSTSSVGEPPSQTRNGAPLHRLDNLINE